MRVDRVLKYSLILSTVLLAACIAWLLYDYLKVFSLFPYIAFFTLTTYTLFIIRLYLNNLNYTKLKFVNWFVISLFTMPVVVGLIQFVQSNFYENYWPVMITLITIQSVLGIMAGFGFHSKVNYAPKTVNTIVLLFGLFGVGWSFLVLAKLVVNDIKQIVFYALVLLSLAVFIGNVVLYVKEKRYSK